MVSPTCGAPDPIHRQPARDPESTAMPRTAWSPLRFPTAGELLGVHVDPGEYHPHDAPGLENMGDMVVEALIDAKARAIAFTQGFSGFAESPAG